jgi:hypothetical protein
MVNPPRAAQPVYASQQAVAQSTGVMLASVEAAPEAASASGGGFLDRMSRAMGLQSTEPEESQQTLVGRPRAHQPKPQRVQPQPKSQVASAPRPEPQPKTTAPEAKPAPVSVAARKPEPARPALRGTTTAMAKPKPPARLAWPQGTAQPAAPSSASPSTMMALTGPVIRGSQPALRSGSFENRWSALR